MELVAAAPTLAAPDLIATNAAGRLTPAQRRVLGRALYRERWRSLAGAIGWIAAALLMLRILLPVALDIIPTLLDRQLRGGTPVTVRGVAIVLPLDTMLRWFLFLFATAYVLTIGVQLWRLIGFLRERQQFLGGGIRSVVGVVRLRDEQPLAIFAGRQVRPWDAAALAALVPGTYRFFLLPRFDWLLAAQRLADGARPTIEEADLAERHSLAAINGFDRDALAENQAGRLTAVQARWLRESAPAIGVGTILLLGGSSAIGVVMAVNAGRAILQGGIDNDHLGMFAAGTAWAAIWAWLVLKQFIDRARQPAMRTTGRCNATRGRSASGRDGSTPTTKDRTSGSIAIHGTGGVPRSPVRRSGRSQTACPTGSIGRRSASSSSISSCWIPARYGADRTLSAGKRRLDPRPQARGERRGDYTSGSRRK